MDVWLRHLADFAVVKELRSESDRVVAIVGAAWMDDRLGEVFRVRLKGGDKFVRALLTGPTGALSTFAARTDIAFAVGLIGPGVHEDLITIRTVRNKFAHWTSDRVGSPPAALTFKTPDVARLCSRLKSCLKIRDVNPAPTPRDKFVLSLRWLANALATDDQGRHTPIGQPIKSLDW